jgi:hypothetical protein
MPIADDRVKAEQINTLKRICEGELTIHGGEEEAFLELPQNDLVCLCEDISLCDSVQRHKESIDAVGSHDITR